MMHYILSLSVLTHTITLSIKTLMNDIEHYDTELKNAQPNDAQHNEA